MKKQQKIIQYLSITQTPYQLKTEDMLINIQYSQNNKKIDDCILNILKMKIRK